MPIPLFAMSCRAIAPQERSAGSVLSFTQLEAFLHQLAKES